MKAPTRVVVHPIVLLSVVDHFNRLRKIGNQKRVVGVLLGKWRASGVVDIATSYAGSRSTCWFTASTVGESTNTHFSKRVILERV